MRPLHSPYLAFVHLVLTESIPYACWAQSQVTFSFQKSLGTGFGQQSGDTSLYGPALLSLLAKQSDHLWSNLRVGFSSEMGKCLAFTNFSLERPCQIHHIHHHLQKNRQLPAKVNVSEISELAMSERGTFQWIQSDEGSPVLKKFN